MNRTIFILAVISALTAQDGNTSIEDPSAVTGAAVDTTSNDSLSLFGDSLGVALDTIGPPMDLDYGYKGFMWGAPVGAIPNLQYMGEPMFIRDSTALQMSGFLGQEAVIIEYVFSDSGFWKVEIQSVSYTHLTLPTNREV